MTIYNGINHLAMATGDMDRTIRFWRDFLGMRLVACFGKPGYRHYFFEISENDMIAFFEWPHVEPVEEKEHGRVVKGPFVFDHISIGVKNRESLWELKDRLNAADIWVSEVIDHGFIHSIYTFDPNGIALEFSHRVADTDVRKTPVMADSAPAATALEGPEPRKGIWPEVINATPEKDFRVYPGNMREAFGQGKAGEDHPQPGKDNR